MSTHARFVVAVLVLTAPVIASMGPRPAGAAAPEGVDSDVQAALAAPVQVHRLPQRDRPRTPG